MSEKGKKVEKVAKKTVKGEDSKDKVNKSPGPDPMGGGDTEVNESAGSKVKAERED